MLFVRRDDDFVFLAGFVRQGGAAEPQVGPFELGVGDAVLLGEVDQVLDRLVDGGPGFRRQVGVFLVFRDIETEGARVLEEVLT